MKEKKQLDKERLIKILESTCRNPKIYYIEDGNDLLDNDNPFWNPIELSVMVIGESSDIVEGIYFYPKRST